MGNPIAWFEIYVQDMARAKRFYEAVFQIKLQALGGPATDMEMWSFQGDMNSYGAPGALVKMAGLPSGGNSTLVYFHCEDCAVEQGRVAGAGGQVHRPKFPIGEYGHIALVTDTEGNMIGLHSMK
jgi:predicted enzyme related to lactoylglutathione lyase